MACFPIPIKALTQRRPHLPQSRRPGLPQPLFSRAADQALFLAKGNGRNPIASILAT